MPTNSTTSTSTGRNVVKSDIGDFYEKSVQERQKKKLKSDKNVVHFTLRINNTKYSAARQLRNWNPQQNIAEGDTQTNYTGERTVALHERTTMLNYTHSVHFVRSAENFYPANISYRHITPVTVEQEGTRVSLNARETL